MSQNLPKLLALIALASSCTNHESRGAESLQGIWKSNAKKTLASMRSVEDVTTPAKELFEDDFFGHLHVEYRGNTIRYWLDDEDYDTGFKEYEVLVDTGEYVTIREWDPVTEELEDSTLTSDGQCFWVTTTAFEFKEYFCRVAEDI